MLNREEMEPMRALAREYARIALDPAQDEKKKLWIAHNDHETDTRPLVLIDQVCWSEMDVDGSLEPTVSDPYWREVELWLRQAVYQWAHMPVDRVFDPYVALPAPVLSTGWGIDADTDVLRLQKSSEVASRHYKNQISEEADLERIQTPILRLDEKEMARIRETAEAVFDGIIPWKISGVTMHLGLWDVISSWMGVESCYIELIDRPEMMHALMEKLTGGVLSQIAQLNEMGLFDIASNICHCSHTYSKRLPGADCDQGKPQSKDAWAFGLAQLFTAASPAITREFEAAYMTRIFPMFGAIYYGCCERLDDRLDVVSKLPNVRKISCSPWSDRERFAERLPRGIIMSNKPTPALLATDSFSEDAARSDIRRTIAAAKRHGRKLEMILKDISTVRNDPKRLWRWAEIAMEEVHRVS
jgi:hypothetical protein